MKNKILFICLIGLIAFSACKKGGSSENKIKFISKISRFIRVSQTTMVTTMTYDDKNRMVQLKQGGANQYFTYEGDNLVKVVETNSSGAEVFTYTISYANGLPTGLKAVSPNTGTENYVYTVVDGKITKATSPRLTIQYTYNTLGQLATYRINNTSTSYYTYTQDKNPFYNARLKYQFMPVGAGFFREDAFSENLQIERLYSYTPFLGTWSNYSMDNDGFPKSAVDKSTVLGDPDSFTYSDLTFEYEMRDPVK